MQLKIGVIGCGNMGGGMVSHLCASKLNVSCYDQNKLLLKQLNQLGATVFQNAQELASSVDVLILSLPTAQIVESVMNEILPALLPETIVLDTSTSVPATSQAMSALGKSNGFEFIDGPVSGGPAAAYTGNMTMLLAGDKSAIDRIKPITDVLTAKTVYVGDSGAGHAAKIANNMLCAANLILVTEAIRLGEASGANAEALLEGINAGSGRSGVSEVNFPKGVLNNTFDSGFTMGLMRKDVRLALELAQRSGIELNGFERIANLWLSESNEIEDTADFNQITNYRTKD